MSYPSKPTLAAIAERLRDRTAPLAPDDPVYGYAHAYLCGALGAIFDEVAGVFDPEGDVPPVAPLLDPTLCPPWALPWLAQMVGITLPDGLSEDDARTIIREVAGFKRGTRQAMEAAAGLWLTGEKNVYFRERDPTGVDPPYTLEVVTFADELPETDKALTNEAPNPSFEVDLANWSAAKGGTANATLTTWARQTGWSKRGSASARFTGSIASAGSIHYINATTPTAKLACNQGEWITVLYALNVLANTTQIVPTINWYTSAGAFLTTSTPGAITGKGIFEGAIVAQAPANAALFNVTIQISGVIGTADLYIDSIAIYRRDEAVDYGDGSMPGWTWSGAAHNSNSIRTPTTLVRDALIRAKPGGIVLAYRTTTGWDYQQMTTEGGLYSALPAKFSNYRKMTYNERT